MEYGEDSYMYRELIGFRETDDNFMEGKLFSLSIGP